MVYRFTSYSYGWIVHGELLVITRWYLTQIGWDFTENGDSNINKLGWDQWFHAWNRGFLRLWHCTWGAVGLKQLSRKGPISCEAHIVVSNPWGYPKSSKIRVFSYRNNQGDMAIPILRTPHMDSFWAPPTASSKTCIGIDWLVIS